MAQTILTQEERDLLTKALCEMLPHGVKIKTPRGIYTVDAVSSEGLFSIPNDNKTLDDLTPHDGHYWLPITDDYKPYLRPMSSITEEEDEELRMNNICIAISYENIETNIKGFDWLNAHHFDYRGLIEKGLALPAPEGMQYRHNGDMPFQYCSGIGIPCWSLPALLELLSFPMLTQHNNGKWCIVSYPNGAVKTSDEYDNPIDATVEMILKLHELNSYKK